MAQIHRTFVLSLALICSTGLVLSQGEASFGCKGKSNCKTIPADCTDESCPFGVTVVKTGDNQYNFYAQVTDGAAKYVAVGISKDESMGEDAVVACASGSVNSYFNPKGQLPSRAKNWTSGFSGGSTASTNGKLTCAFTLPEDIDVDGSLKFNLSDSTILIATGQFASGLLTHHTNRKWEVLLGGSSGKGPATPAADSTNPKNSKDEESSGATPLPAISVVASVLLVLARL